MLGASRQGLMLHTFKADINCCIFVYHESMVKAGGAQSSCVSSSRSPAEAMTPADEICIIWLVVQAWHEHRAWPAQAGGASCCTP